jgi:pimeloyl-ACP methyl ester carboxylesterase
METQRGEKWEKVIKEENKRFRNALSTLKPLISKSSSDRNRNIGGWSIEVSHPHQVWTHLKSGFSCKCWDADYSDGLFAAAVQDKDGFERFTLEIYKVSKKHVTHLKTLEKVGPTLAIQGDSILYLESEKDIRYSILNRWSEDTSEVLYKLDDLKENLELKRGEDGSVYCLKSDFTRVSYGLIDSKVKWSDEPLMKSGIPSEQTKIPGIKDIIESFSLKAGWAVSINKGIRALWNLDTKKPIVWIWGDVSFDSRDPFTLEISDIRYEPYILKLPKWVLSNPKAHPFPCSYYEHPLPVFVAHPNPTSIQSAKGILFTTYSAYGTPTHSGSLIQKWKPLLERGWIVASVMLPGSGDHDKAWVKNGQRKNRLYAIDQFRDSIQSLQEEFGFPKEKTALYGRSAGGLIVSSLAIRYPDLVGALYVESPYVDILRTITNPELPLTTLETTEFGSLEDPVNIITTAEWSPMEHIPEEGLPELFVVARTDLNDLEVFPYEVVKFIQRIRGNTSERGQKKLLFVHEGLGHFTTSSKSRGEDLALLDNWINGPGMRKKNLGHKYKMAFTRKNHTRKNKNNGNSAVTVGGRRRRNGRKSRRGSRRH